jgi:hypothetical protein
LFLIEGERKRRKGNKCGDDEFFFNFFGLEFKFSVEQIR